MALDDLLDDGVEFRLFGLIDHVVHVVGRIGRLVGNSTTSSRRSRGTRLLGLGGTGHAGELVVHTEVVLEGDGRQRLALFWTFTPSLASMA